MSTDFENIRPIRDEVLIEKIERFDKPKKFGSIWLPQQSNLNIRESKVGRIISHGLGYYTPKDVFVPLNLNIGALVYYTRYGKESFTPIESDKTHIICPSDGVLAYIDTYGYKIIEIHPRLDRLVVEEIENKNIRESGIIIVGKTKKDEYDRYRQWKVLKVGPGKLSLNSGKLLSMTVKVGHVVVTSLDAGASVSWNYDGNRVKFMLVPEGKCIGYCEESELQEVA